MYFSQQSGKYVKDLYFTIILVQLVSTRLSSPEYFIIRESSYIQVVVVVVKAVWGIFNDTNGLYIQVDTLLVIYKSWHYSINAPTCKIVI